VSSADAVRSAGRLLGGLGAVVRDRLRSATDVPRDIDGVDAAWLDAALRDRGARVRGVERLGEHSGTTTRARLALEYDERADMPDTLFLKITPASLPQRLFGHVMRLGAMEVRFYRELRRDLPVRAPEVVVARASVDGARFVLLLEDLSHCRFVDVGSRVSLDEARAVVRALAVLHAHYWESPRFANDLAWLRCLENRARDLPLERFLTAQMVKAAVRRFGADMPDDFVRAARLVCDRRDVLEARWAEGPRTLVHGDCHVGNLFFEGESVGFLDWQVLARAPGIRDVAYFLCNSLPAETRREHEEALVSMYREGLVQAGTDAPMLPTLWDQYRSFALYAWIAAAFTAGAGGLQSERIARAGLERTTKALVDLETVALLA
jgi:Ser/Thr protein kinase RdoA (MazF antagonist)